MSEGDDVAESDGEKQTIGARTSTPDAFISYASHDTHVAAALEDRGLKCWIAPRDVTPGAHYASEIVHAIDSARAIVLILSQDAANSPRVLREIERAASKRHPVPGLRYADAHVSHSLRRFCRLLIARC
jgi:TIR domain-containing protein